MENININSSPKYKIFELNFPDKYFFDKITNIFNVSKSKKIKNHRNINKYKRLTLNGKTLDLSERNKSTIMAKSKNLYSLSKILQ